MSDIIKATEIQPKPVRKKELPDDSVICWQSGGVTSAVAGMIAVELFGIDKCKFLFIDTKNEDDDTYRFLNDLEGWFGKPIEYLTALGPDKKYKCIQDTWYKNKSLNIAKGAICSAVLKREVREKWQRENTFEHQVFGFDITEYIRVLNMIKSYPETNPLFTLMFLGYTKKRCIQVLQDAGIEVPISYKLGYNNNNCRKTGCVQAGGVGYWQKMDREEPKKVDAMAKVEHDLTDIKGHPVTILKDQSKEAVESGNILVFLRPHPDYPHIKDLSMMKGQKVKPIMECNGFCGVNGFNGQSLDDINMESDKRPGSVRLSLFDGNN